MKSPIRVGIIGCGLMGGIHAECYVAERSCEIVGFYNRTREKAENLATQFGGDVFDSVDDLLRDSRIDAVSITSSQQAHAEQVIAAANAKKHILCEKPLGLTVDEFEAMAKAVKKSGHKFMVGHQLRFHPVVDWIIKAMPRLGPVYHIDLEMAFRIDSPKGRCWEDYRSGGFFMELGCHLADLAHYLMGDIRHVSGVCLRINPERVTEDYTNCLLQFQSGAAGSIIVSANHRTQRQGLLKGRVLGQKGRIDFTIYPYSRALNAATLVLDGGKSIFVPDVRKETIKTPFPPSPSKVYPGFFDVYQKEIHAFLESIRNDTTPPITFEDGRAAIEVVLATYNSQAQTTEHPNFENGLGEYRSDAASHPLLQQSTASKRKG